MRASLPQVELWTHDRGASRCPRATASRSPSTRCCAGGSSSGPRDAGGDPRTEPVAWALLERVHDGDLLRRIRDGDLTLREQRGLGLPWSPELVERGRRSVAGTLAAARHALERGVAMNLGGGTHHAGRAFARGYCLFNDVVVTLARAARRRPRAARAGGRLRRPPGRRHRRPARPPTRTRTRSRCTARATTRSSASPPTSTSTSPAGTGDADYLEALDQRARRRAARRPPEIAFYLAGADPWEGDRLGRLALTKAGLRARDALVLDRLRATGARVCVVLAGGYAEDVRDTVDINAATAATVASRHET